MSVPDHPPRTRALAVVAALLASPAAADSGQPRAPGDLFSRSRPLALIDPAAHLLRTDVVYISKDIDSVFRGRYVGLTTHGGEAFNFVECEPSERRRLLRGDEVAEDRLSDSCAMAAPISVGELRVLPWQGTIPVRVVTAANAFDPDCFFDPAEAAGTGEGASADLVGTITGALIGERASGDAVVGYGIALGDGAAAPDAAPQPDLALPVGSARLGLDEDGLTATIGAEGCAPLAEQWVFRPADEGADLPALVIPHTPPA